jgi:MerR family mercuric resistance operon transcriptional regulator
LEEVNNLLQLERSRCCGETHDLAVRKLALINAKIADLIKIQRALEGLVHQCEAGNQEGDCPIIQSLTQEV